MKIKLDIDLTPHEARKLMGMPDLEPMQKAIMKQVQTKIMGEIEHATDVDYLFNKFLPLGVQSIEQMRKFASAMTFSDEKSSDDEQKAGE